MTFADVVTAAADLVNTLGLMPLIVAGGIIGVFGVLLRRTKGGIR